jgi:protocatechuate 3,4-dioxygenase beta subunit
MPRALVHLENLAIARTDSQGRFLFTNVPTGAKQLTVRASDLKPRSERVSILSNKVIDSTIKFGLGEKIVKVRETLLAPNTNTALSGKVLDNRSNPVSGAKVSVVGLAKAAYVRTHADGSYEMRGLKPGQYQVLVSRVGYADANQTVSLRAGLREQRAFRIAQTNSQIERDLVQRVVTRLCEIRGQVRAVNGGPVPYATVELKAAARGSNGATFKTNSRGEYSFKAIAGRYELKVKAKNFQEATGIATLQVGNSARKDFDLKPDGSSTNAGGTRPETGRLSGRVTDGINAKPIPGAIVSIEGQKATTDRSGSYTVSNLAKGNHRVTVSKSGYSDETAQVAIQADGSTQKYFAMRPKAAPDRPPDALRPGHLNGRITDERTGKPIVGASVSVLGRTIVTDRTGNYAVTDLPRGKHQVSVTSRGYHNDRETVEVRAGSSTNKDFKLKSASGSAGGDLPRGTGQLRGRVTEAGTGRLISGARISISGQGSATTDSGGNYTITNLRPGKYPVRVTSSRYLSKTEDIEIKAGSSTNRIFVLEPASNGNRNTSTSGNRNSKSGKSPRQIRN